METLTLQYNQAIKEELLKVLEKFSKKDLEIIDENPKFDQVREELHADYEYTKRPDAVFYSIDEVEKMFEDENL
ncbi:hypothetical protein [Epilithonimonas xixisoli]|uniref:Addiction module component n=1 Tax=Epilithonimonas xixisoli TaxID=1476462 RepID=A0A4R8IFD5_9FLAO|nr:hypothetical protein [Epilithonimonas xixisoli]TDX84420.1 hypothetical protein B0I22_2039 [Epilithonimonas xixisoli]